MRVQHGCGAAGKGTPRADTRRTSITAINARAAITRAGERRKVFMKEREELLGEFGTRQGPRFDERRRALAHQDEVT
jgi:hypothetical protein